MVFAPIPLNASTPPRRTPARRHGATLALLAAACALAGCQPSGSPTPKAEAAAPAVEPAAAPAAAAPAVPVAYTPPSADALYQMVAPIALYPDRLVAQILAGATYPDQIGAAETWLAQNPSARGGALAAAVDPQPWDPSVKSLTAFPNVLEQMAANLPWTTALGKAYYHDPSDVMNAIQVMRARAAKAGTLKASPHLRVATVEARSLPPPPAPAQPPVALYQGPAVIAPPPTVITIQPTEVQTVYVPRYDPAVVYGTPVPVYPSYRWAVPAPAPVAVSTGPDPVAVGALAFGAGVLVGAVASHHHAWGWDAWNLHWGPPPPPAPVAWGPAPPPPAWGPAVLYRGATYVSNSPTVIENIHNRITVNNRNVYVNAPGQPAGAPGAASPVAGMLPGGGSGAGLQAGLPPPGAMAPGRPPQAVAALPDARPLAAALHEGHAAPGHPGVGMLPPGERMARMRLPSSGGAPQPQLQEPQGRALAPTLPAQALARPVDAAHRGAPEQGLGAALQRSGPDREGRAAPAAGAPPRQALSPAPVAAVHSPSAADRGWNRPEPARADVPPAQAALQARPFQEPRGLAEPVRGEGPRPSFRGDAAAQAQMPREASMAHALQSPPVRAVPAPRMAEPASPVHAAPREAPVAALHPAPPPQQQQSFPRAEARPEPRPAAMHESLRGVLQAPPPARMPHEPPHPPHGQDGGHRPHGEGR